MIGKYYNSILEQTFKKIGTENHNIVLVKYSNDFSIHHLEISDTVQKSEEIFFEKYEFERGAVNGAYEPFLAFIQKMFQQYMTISFDEFMEKCQVYSLHKSIFESYFRSGMAERKEQLIYNEVQSEKEIMERTIVRMLIEISKVYPFLLLINRLQLASKSTFDLLQKLLEEDCHHFGIVLGMSETQRIPEYKKMSVESLTTQLEDLTAAYRIGTAGVGRTLQEPIEEDSLEDEKEQERQIHNIVSFLDFEHAAYYLEIMNRRLKFENYTMTDKRKIRALALYAEVSIYLCDFPKALELCEDMLGLVIQSQESEGLYRVYYIKATVNMYQGKLKEAIELAQKAAQIATEFKMEFWKFKAELLVLQAKMSGWNNIFFCTQNIEISDSMVEKLIQYQYFNHLAYIYIYAYDNKPEIVAKAYRSESQLLYFSKGIELAQKIGNERLVYNAYQKNIMLAAANGMYEIAILYSVRTFEALSNKKSTEAGRVYTGLGYNLSAIGQYQMVKPYFLKAIEVFYDLNASEDIAEVLYNMALNDIALNDFVSANDNLIHCVKSVEKLGLNSLRVCNLSKLYALLALCNQKLGNPFNAERYLEKCNQFLSYVFEKNANSQDMEFIHDYAKCEDDAFLYYFALALYQMEENNDNAAFESLSIAEKYLMSAEGNEIFCYRLFRETRKTFFQRTNRIELMNREKELLTQFEWEKEENNIIAESGILAVVDNYIKADETRVISSQDIERLLNQESTKRDYLREKNQLNFISTWQKTINVNNVPMKEMVANAMKTFLYHINGDRALYIQYEGEPEILYNDTQIAFTEEKLMQMKRLFEKEARGFVFSKVNSSYAEHAEVIDIFGADEICSMIAIPFFDNRKVTSILITYVLMKDNWHSSVNRYMLNERDFSICELLFREMQYSIGRLKANAKIYEMNKKLYHSAITDQLTGLLNRKGFYKTINKVIQKINAEQMENKLAIMFIDLDNFKTYNDTFGHDTGDLILKNMAQIFEKVCSDKGFVTRYGGDEFIITWYTDDRKLLQEKAECIYQEIRSQNGFLDQISQLIGKKVEMEPKKLISCSIGINISTEIHEEEDVNRMMKQADDLLYKVKKQEKGTYKFI